MSASAYNPANLLSLLRVVAAPFFVVLYHEGHRVGALLVFASASLTDFLDGFLARRFGWRTKLGEFIDPLGDKLLTLSAVALLLFSGRLHFWAAVLAFAREIVVLVGFLLLAVVARRVEIQASLWGKAGTLLQMGLLILALAWQAGWLPARTWPGLQTCLEAAIAFNFLSSLDYVARGAHDFEKKQRGQKA